MSTTPHRRSFLRGKDEGRLAELGYTQQLTREWGLLHNFGASFSIISVITGITTCENRRLSSAVRTRLIRPSLFGYGLNTGGPAVMSIGWIVVSFFTLLVGASMAEILSSIPTSGGPYFWAYMLAPQQHAPFFAWITGWFNLIGQIAVTTGINFGLANLISTTAYVSNGYHGTAGKTLGILAVILISHVAVNLLSIGRLRYMIYTSIFLNTVGVFCLIVSVVAKAPKHQSAAFVFSKFFDGTSVDGEAEGWSVRASPAYVAATGVLMSQYTILGYDASAHLCEETRKAVRDAPIGLLSAIVSSAVIGFFVIVAMLFSIQDFDAVRASPLPVLQILTDTCGKGGGLVLMVLIMLCIWHCGLFSLTSNSRMMFAFARDGGIPHRLHIIDTRFKSPIRTVIFGAACSFLLALPVLGSGVAFSGTTSIATIGLYISYVIPIAMTIAYPRNFKRGPFKLGAASKPVAYIACLWVAFITVAFCLPTVNPVVSQNFNYTAVALGIVGIFAFGSWFLWAHKWFTGRCRDHCRICIRQLDFLGEEMVDRSPREESERRSGGSGRHERFKSNERGNRGGNAGKITVSQEFEIRGFQA
ncbi:MAG: hypothetical protein L6R40_004241 [Gallowayella cf. fulva]|nr:MAG: hypothetical protein L6R40_004241 [Xanthomendoza cf. fulva]